MKKILLPMLVIMSLSAFAGNEKGNGGGAFVCRNSTGKILKAELVDFVEGRAEYGLTILKNEKTVEDQINRAVNRMLIGAPLLAGELQSSIDKVKEIMNITSEIELENTNDFNLRLKPRDCDGGKTRFEQLANYTDDGRLVIDGEIYNQMPTSDKAALIVHEAAYLLARESQDATSSREARRLTAHLFSNKEIKLIPGDVFKMTLIDSSSNQVWSCTSVFATTTATFDDGNWRQGRVNVTVATTSGSTKEKAFELLDKEYTAFQENFPANTQTKRREFRACAGDSSTSEVNRYGGANNWYSWECPGRVFTPALDCKKN